MSPASKSYSQILKSSALIGSSTLVSLAFSIIRTKAMAILLGPAGVGLFSIYGSIADLCQCLAGMGINSSGVRQIAEAAGTGDADRIARTTTVLRRISIFLGVFGALLLALLSTPISYLTFGSSQEALWIALLGVAIFFRLVSSGQSALIQGLRRISDLARLGVLGAFFGMLIGVPIVYFWREQGIVPSMIAVAAVSVATSWWYSQKIDVRNASLSVHELSREARGFVALGVAFMAVELLALFTAYATRLLLIHYDGVVGAGLYQAAWVLGGMYAGFILQAMGADFYPRLTAAADDDLECNRLVNEQAEIGMLIAFPGVITTLTLAPLIMTVFYSTEFNAAADALRWICLGMTLRIISWPLGYIVIAKAARRTFVSIEIVATAVQLGLSALLIPYLGVNGAGMAFFGLYVFHTILVYVVARRMIDFRISAENKTILLAVFPSIAVVFCCLFFLPFGMAIWIGCLASAASVLFASRALMVRIPPSTWPHSVRRWFPKTLLARI